MVFCVAKWNKSPFLLHTTPDLDQYTTNGIEVNASWRSNFLFFNRKVRKGMRKGRKGQFVPVYSPLTSLPHCAIR